MKKLAEQESQIKSLDQLIEEVFEWQQETFRDGTEEGRVEHFKEEIDEWLADPSNGEEAVDVFSSLSPSSNIVVSICVPKPSANWQSTRSALGQK